MHHLDSKSLIRSVLFFAGVATSFGAFADVNVWTPFGPEGGEGGRILAHPTNSNRLFAVGAGRIFRSDDAAATWRPIMNGLPDGRADITIEFSPANPDVIYAVIRSETASSLERVYRTGTAGLRWQRLPYVRPGGSKIIDISVSPTDSNKIIIANTAPGAASIVMSDNGGASFFSPSTYASSSNITTSATRHGNNAFSAVRNSTGGPPVIYKSIDNGVTWGALTGFPTSVLAVVNIRTAPSNGNVLYGNGETFGQACIDPCIDGFRLNVATNVFTALPSVVFPQWINPTNSNTTLQPFLNVTSASLDAGSTFTPKLSISDGYFFDVAGHPAYPSTPTFYVSSATRGVLKTTNDGASNAPANFGFNGVKVQSLALFNVNATSYRLYAGQESEYTSRGVSVRGLSDVLAPTAWVSLPVDAVGSTGVPALLVDFTTGSRLYAGNNFSTLLRSTNTGSTWSATNLSGIESVEAIALDPRSCAVPPISGVCTSGPLQTVLVGGRENSSVTAGASSRALQVSDDGGVTFTSVSGFPRPLGASQKLRVNSISFNNANPNLVYAGTNLVGSGALGASANGVFKSADNGRSWALSNSGIPLLPGGGTNTAYNVGAIKTTPSNGAVIYVGVHDNPLAPSVQSGLYKSSNNGVSWSFTGLSRRMIRDILVSPSNANLIYVALSGTAAGPGGVVRSTDAGVTWQAIATGLPAAGAFALAARGSQLFAGTPNGVYDFFQGPDVDLDNVTTSVEDAAPNGGDLNADGILDSAQSKTASFLVKTVNDGTPSAPTRGRTNYTNEEDNTSALFPERAIQAGCGQLNNAFGIDPEIYPEDKHPSGIVYDASDLGLVNVELNDCAFAVITVRFDDGNFTDPLNWSWRNYGPVNPGDDDSFGWYQFPGAQRIDSTTWRLTINANQLGVYRAEANSILLRGGPSFFPERLLTTGFE